MKHTEPNGLPTKTAGNHFFPDPLFVVGPCSAETEEQVLQTASLLKPEHVSYFRAGIWKPRTSPESFQGVGKVGLRWLQLVKELYGFKVTTEVANGRHVEEALKAGLDMLWIGARSTVNPFTVQEIADALKGVNIPVMVKNPINPDLGLWVGAIKRLRKAGIQHIAGCHRGFNIYNQKTVLRNTPLWEIPLEFKRLHPEIPLICDPSHISGAREYIFRIAQKSLDLGFQGLLIETHPTPDTAWSDAKQQVTPTRLAELMNSFVFRKTHSDSFEYKLRLRNLRETIDGIDDRLLELLADRMEVAKKIGELKNERNVAFFQHNRWSDVIERCKHIANQLTLDEQFVLKLFSLIHLESLDIQGE